eukprot:XP_014022983.1 PREDICTED: protein B4 [Salmo salar]
MAPKKTVASEEGIASSDSPNKDEKVSGKAKSESSKAPDVAQKTPLHPPTMMMVKEALKELDSRKGVSSQAIRSYIREKYPSLDQVRLKYMMRKALNKGIESGVLVRPPNSTASGAQGRFRLAGRGNVKEPKPKATENTNPNVAKASKAGAKKTKEKEAVSETRTTAKKQKTSEDAKPKKAPGGSKVAPTKKPKAKRPAVEGGAEVAAEDQPKALKTTKAAKKGEGAAKKGEGAAKKGEGAAKKGEGAAKKGEGAAKKGEGAAKKGEGAAKKGEGAPAARTTGKRGKKGAAE